jgi:hypothetical protein
MVVEVSDASESGDEVTLSGVLGTDDSGRGEPLVSEPVPALVISVPLSVVMLVLTLLVLLEPLSLTLVIPIPLPPVVGIGSDNSVCVVVIAEVLGRV